MATAFVPPSGTVTFLFTDVEGSTRLWEEHPSEMRVALERHDEIVRSAVERNGGFVFATTGDGFAGAFGLVGEALAAATEAQRDLGAEQWPSSCVLRVRMGMSTGEAQERGGDFFGPVVNRAARVMSAAHGGQVLLASTSAALAGPEVDLFELGAYRLKDLGSPEVLTQLGAGQFPPLRTLERSPHNLPVRRGELLGRDEQLGAVSEAVGLSRLVTLTGMGGTGKTSLALAASAELIERFADGVWFVDLAAIDDGQRVAAAVGQASGLVMSSGTDDELAGLLDGRSTLLLLDNCEHLVDDVADLVDLVLESTDGPQVLATSREPLELPDERVMVVPPLSAGDADGAAAVALFEATAARIGAATLPADSATIASICQRLDGLPLAIELAAGQLGHMSLSELEARLDQRFDLLSRGRGRRQRRHASLQGVLEQSWELLPPAERDLLSALSVCPSSFDLATVEGLCEGSEVVPSPAVTLRSLVNRSLVSATTVVNDSSYRLLETVKLYAHRQLSEPERHAFADRHLDWLLACVNRVAIEDQCTYMPFANWYHRYYDEIRAAAQHALATGRVEDAADLTSAGVMAWYELLDFQAVDRRQRVERLLAEPGLSNLLQARLHLAAAYIASPADAQQRTEDHATAAAELAERAGCPAVEAAALTIMSWWAALRAADDALAIIDRAQHIGEEAGLPEIAAGAAAYRPSTLALTGRVDDAIDELERQLAESYDDEHVAARILRVAGWAWTLLAKPSLAATLIEGWRDDLAKNNRPPTWNAYLDFALVAAHNGNYEQTSRELDRAEQAVHLTGAHDGLPDLLLAPALAAYTTGETARCSHYLAAVRAAEQPTQNQGRALLYRELKRQVPRHDPNEDLTHTVAIYEQSRNWLRQLATSDP